MACLAARRLFSVEEYYRMGEAGVLRADDRVELIEGEIIQMTPIESRHAACVNRLNMLFNRLFTAHAVVSVQNPVRLDNVSEPVPDVALLQPRDDYYAKSLPVPEEVLLIVEVADTSREYDRTVKVPLYAAAGIPEVWLVDLAGERVETHTQPVGGSYAVHRTFARGDSVRTQELPELALTVESILG